MFWETLSALYLMLTTAKLWIPVAIVWGLLNGAFFIVLLVFSLFSAIDSLSELLLAVLYPVVRAFSSAWDVPEIMWNWAKFEHPWWAFFIAPIITGWGLLRPRKGSSR